MVFSSCGHAARRREENVRRDSGGRQPAVAKALENGGTERYRSPTVRAVAEDAKLWARVVKDAG
jgi:hypothetical protein